MSKFRPGVSFSDFVISDVVSKRSKIKNEGGGRDYRKGWLVWMGVLVAFGILGMWLVQLQLFYGDRYRLLSQQNSMKKIKLPAARGDILDRNGKILAQSVKDGEKWKRVYPAGATAVMVVGYVGEVSETEVGLLKTSGGKYDAGDSIGRAGIEAQYEERLRGEDGGRLVEVDSAGNFVREMGKKEPVKGENLQLTIDKDLQEKGLTSLNGRKGAVVASDPNTGEILALVSSPSFDPNSRDAVQEAMLNPELPMFNRAIGAVYPPGSTFKMITTAAAISSGKVRSDFTFNDQGYISVGGSIFNNWLFTKGGGVEGAVGFSRAIVRSTDTFFYTVGEMTGPEIIGNWAKKFGLGQKTGIDLAGEVAGLMPSPDWKIKTKGEQWYLGNTYHVAIGQGDILATPIQINLMTDILATNGSKCGPHLIKGTVCTNVEIDPAALKIIHEGMLGACSAGGTAYPLFDFVPKIACKTGTAEYMAEDGKMRTHGWLTGFAPADKPKISITAVLEGGGEGSDVAAPVVRKMLSVYFGVEDTYNYSALSLGSGE